MDFCIEKTCDPCQGHDLARLEAFLKGHDLTYDQAITHTFWMEDEEGIFATGSCHGNVLKCIAIAPSHQGEGHLATVMMHLLEHLVAQGISHYFVFTKPKNHQMFRDMGLHTITQTEHVLLMENRRDGLKTYVQSLVKRAPQLPKVSTIGAVVANCNPFTWGHRYLIETAASQCDLLHLFILSEENQAFGAKARLDMVRLGVADLANVVVHQTSDYLVSPAVFPTYFIKDKALAADENCKVDIQIFGDCIAPALGITHRFVGTEPNCMVTNHYNACMKALLPLKHITLVELPRKTTQGQVISASTVRKAIETQDLALLKEMLPPSTLDYLHLGL